MRYLMVIVLACASSCKDDEPPPPVEPTPPPVAAESEPEPEPAVDWVTSTTSLRRQPTRDRKVEIDGKKVSNWLATLHRGELVTVLEPGDGWVRVRTSADNEGWLAAAAMLGEESAAPATVLAPAQTFARPDLVAVSGDPIPAGTLLFVTGEKDAFSRVDAPGRKPVWVESDGLLTATEEVRAARLATRVLALEAKGDKDAAATREMLESQFGSTRLVRALRGDTEPEAIKRPLEKVAYAHDDNRRDYRFHLDAPVGTAVSLTMSVNGEERCRMLGTFAQKGAVLACVVQGEVDNEAQVALGLTGFVVHASGDRVDVDEKTTGSFEDMYDASIDIAPGGQPEIILAKVCPWVYVTDDGVIWERRKEIIRNLDARAKEGHQRVHLGPVRVLDGQIRLRIREEERETSYLDNVALEVNGRQLTARPAELARVDGEYRVLRYGEQIELRFEVPEQGVVDAWIHASGYYLPEID